MSGSLGRAVLLGMSVAMGASVAGRTQPPAQPPAQAPGPAQPAPKTATAPTLSNHWSKVQDSPDRIAKQP